MSCKCLFIKLNFKWREMFFLLLLHLCLLDDCLKNHHHHLIIRSNKPWFSSTSSSSPSSFPSRSDGRELMMFFPSLLTYFTLTSEGFFLVNSQFALFCCLSFREIWSLKIWRFSHGVCRNFNDGTKSICNAHTKNEYIYFWIKYTSHAYSWETSQ